MSARVSVFVLISVCVCMCMAIYVYVNACVYVCMWFMDACVYLSVFVNFDRCATVSLRVRV